MAYGVYRAAVLPDDVASFRSNPTRLPVPQLITEVSCLAPFWNKVQPLRNLLGRRPGVNS